MTEFWNSVVTIVIAIVGIAGLAVLVSRNANTAGVITAGGQSVGGLLGVALSPITGAGVGSNAMMAPNIGANFLG
jgi:hypothetical protein